jgi:hypothetical protein
VEGIGAVGVIVSLIYLAIQVRRGTQQAYADNLQTATDRWAAAQRRFWGTEESSAFVRRALNDYEGLSKDEKSRFTGWLQELMLAYHPILVLAQRGLIDPEAARLTELGIAGFLRCPGGAAAWRELRRFNPPELVERLDRAVEEANGPLLTESVSWLQPDA